MRLLKMKLSKTAFVFAVLVFEALMFAPVLSQENQTQTALDSILHAMEEIKEMKTAGFGTVQATDILILMNYSYQNRDYASVLRRAGEISEIKEKAFLVSDSIKALQSKIKRYNDTYNITEALPIYEDVLTAFAEERYSDTEDLIAKTYTKLDEIKSASIISQTLLEAGKKNIIYFIKENWPYLLIAGIIIILFIILFYGEIEVMVAKNVLKSLETEKNVLRDLMKKAQIECYQKRTIPQKIYETKMEKYKERMVKIDEELPHLKLAIHRGPIGIFRRART
jgi:gas vesicle protein